jgi:tetratricopeptide (TPR) repeat protein
MSTRIFKQALSETPDYTDFFQQRLQTLLTHWRDHAAVQQVQVAVLDREREVILKAINLGLDSTPLWPLVCPLILAFAPYMERRGHWAAWETVLQRAIAVAQQVSDPSAETTLTALLARLSQRMSHPQDVVRYYRRALHLGRQTGNRFEIARACSNLGFHYIDRGRWWRSEVLSQRALGIFEQLDSNHGRAHTHNHLGLLYTRQRRWPEAEVQLKSACEVWVKMGDQHSIIYGYENLSVLYNDMVRPTEALTWLEKAYDQVKLTGEEAELGKILANMGTAWRDNGDPTRAESYLSQAEAIFRRDANQHGLAQAWGHLGILYLQQARWSEARPLLQNSKLTFHAVQAIDSEVTALTYLIECELLSAASAQAELYLNEAEHLLTLHDLGQQGDFFVERIGKLRQRLPIER